MTIPLLTLLLSLLGSPARAQAFSTATVTGQAIGVSSITWIWNAVPNATGYEVLDASNSDVDLSGMLPPSASSFTETMMSNSVLLTTNTEYGVQIEAFFSGPATTTSTLTQLYTLAGQPFGSALIASGPQPNVVTLSWAAEGNPAGTTYDIDWWVGASTPIVFSTMSVAGSSVVATIPNLPSGQTVTLAVQAVNGNGFATPFDVFLTTGIVSLFGQTAISSGSYALGVSSIDWSWSASTSAIYYQLFSDTGGAISPPLPPNQLSFIETGLSTNTAYTDYVISYAVNASTSSTPFTQYTLAAPTTGLTLVSVTTATASALLSWGANTDPAGTNYLVEWWSAVSSTITVSTGATSAVLNNLAGGSTLYFTVQAENGANPPVISTFDATYLTLLGPPTTWFAVSITSIPAYFSGTLNFLLPTAELTISLATGTFNVPVYITAGGANLGPSPGDDAPLPSGGLQEVGSFNMKIFACQQPTPCDESHTVQPTLPIMLFITYLPASTFANAPGDTAIIRYDANHAAWVPLATQKYGNVLSAITDQLSVFALSNVTPANSLSNITVGPNPLRPIVNPGEVMTFRNLPPGARLRIFTYVGEKIWDVTADASGDVAWDGRNVAGSMVASGIYIVLIDGAGGKKTMRVAIER